MRAIIASVLEDDIRAIELNITRELLVAIYDCFNMRAKDYVRQYRDMMKDVTEYHHDEIDWCRIDMLWNVSDDEIVQHDSSEHTLIQVCTFDDLYKVFLDYDTSNKKV